MPGPGDSPGALIAALFIGLAVLFGRWWLRRGGVTRRQPRAPLGVHPDYFVLATGVLLVLIAVVVGPALLRVASGPTSKEENVGFVIPGATGPGIVLGMSIYVEDCGNPVKVTLAAGGSAEYWRQQARRLGANPRFSLVVPRVDFQEQEYEFGMGESPSDLTGPTFAKPVPRAGFVADPPKRMRNLSILTGHPRRWADSQEAVVAVFEADWLERRTIGSCYLKLPGLVGEDGISPAQQALGNASTNPASLSLPVLEDPNVEGIFFEYDETLAPTFGSIAVLVGEGSVQRDTSLPSPDGQFNGHPRWTCRYTQRDRKREGEEKSFSVATIEQAQASTCAGIAVISENGAGTRRDLLLLLTGAVISLGVTLVVELLLGWMKDGSFPWRGGRGQRNTAGRLPPSA